MKGKGEGEGLGFSMAWNWSRPESVSSQSSFLLSVCESLANVDSIHALYYIPRYDLEEQA